ncbi:MAG: efflux RND transporter periplasmic adaptor subunit [Acidobacteriota bacterium]
MMKNTVTAALSGICLAAACMMMLAGCSADNKQQAQATPAGVVQVVPVQAAVVSQTPISVTKTFSGSLEGEDQANIVSKISERITGIAVPLGSQIQAGRTAIMLDKSGTTSSYYQSEANFKNSQKTYERMKSLFAEGAISQEQLDGAQTAYTVARANFDAARAAVELTSPISGVVTALNVSKGDLAAPGAVLMTVAKINAMKVIFSSNETDVTSLSVGQKVSVYSDARPDVKAEGRIIQISKSADVGSRSFEVKALFSNTRDSWFKPGMFCTVNVQFMTGKGSLIVPNAAVQTDGTDSRVFVLKQGKAEKRGVRLGATDGAHTEVLSGLSAGDTLATVGVNNVKDGGAVKVVGVQN